MLHTMWNYTNLKPSPTPELMTEQQPPDDHAASRQKSARWVRFKIRAFLL